MTLMEGLTEMTRFDLEMRVEQLQEQLMMEHSRRKRAEQTLQMITRAESAGQMRGLASEYLETA